MQQLAQQAWGGADLIVFADGAGYFTSHGNGQFGQQYTAAGSNLMRQPKHETGADSYAVAVYVRARVCVCVCV